MSQITGKTIYVLGAGASHHTGAPLLRDFLVTARLLCERKGELKYRESFNRVFNWIDNLRGSSYYVEFDLDNIEHVFSLAEMSEQLGLSGGKEIHSDLGYVVMETLDKCQVKYYKGQWRPDDDYRKFVENLRKLNEQRENYINKESGTFEKDVIITFNYDVMLDYAMNFLSIKPEYCLYSPPYIGDLKLLKLHGSTNWAICRECKKNKSPCDPQIEPPNPILPGRSQDPSSLKDGAQMEFKMVTDILPNTRCIYCKKTGTLEPVFIPPTWSKFVRGSAIANVWASAVNEIKNAFQIVVIGYSMPPTDTFFQYLLTLGLASNPNLHRVVVVNTDNSDGFKQRYRNVFARSLDTRQRLKFIKCSFNNFVDIIESVGRAIEWGIPEEWPRSKS